VPVFGVVAYIVAWIVMPKDLEPAASTNLQTVKS
jgi:phage shock protein PspC (stress-responsive transcriptional regulator)